MNVLQQAGGRTRVAQLVLEVGFDTQVHIMQDVAGAQQDPAEAGGSQAVSSPAEVGTPAHMQWGHCTSRDGVTNGWRAHLREEEGPRGLLIPRGPRSPISGV